MDLFLEFFSVLCIICVSILSFYIYNLKLNARVHKVQIDSLRSQLTKDSSSYQSQEKKLQQDINYLRSEFSKKDSFIEKREIDLEKKENTYLEKIKDLEKELNLEVEARKKVLSQKKSSEVRIGNIAEKLAPFLDDFEFDPEKCIFLGQPIDYISFGEDEITFIEVKSGKSQLNARQRQIRDLVKAKHISWKEFRII